MNRINMFLSIPNFEVKHESGANATNTPLQSTGFVLETFKTVFLFLREGCLVYRELQKKRNPDITENGQNIMKFE